MATKTLQPGAAAVRPRIRLGPDLSLGPGKVDLLRAVSETGSISAAARRIGMSYKRAWFLIDTLNRGFGEPVVLALAGGRGGGGASLTRLGEAVVRHYLRMEANCQVAVRPDVIALKRLLARRPR
jgi:molybdate transport system regulatory protein